MYPGNIMHVGELGGVRVVGMGGGGIETES